MILSHQNVKKWAKEYCTPYEEKNINPASIDLRLSNSIRVPKFDLLPWYEKIWERFFPSHVVTKKLDPDLIWSDNIVFGEYILYPRRFVLCSSVEFTTIPNTMSGILMLKSSIGRMGLEHSHAGMGDPGFSGQWTFELFNPFPYPIKLVAGETYTQLVLFWLDEETDLSYTVTGRYNNQVGATPHRVSK